MPFAANLNTLGVPDFQIVHIDVIEVAKALQSYLETGSNLTGVSLKDIDTSVVKLPDNPSTATLTSLLAVGMKLFDAIVWISAGRPSDYPLVTDPGKTKDNIPSMHQIARAVFYCYFMLLTQARYPASAKTPTQDRPRIANFLRTIMGMDEDQTVYVERICSFEPQKFNPAWVKHVSFQGFGQEVLSRFGLGVAGYRSFGPFGLYTPRDDLSEQLQRAVTFARTVARAPASWDIHPLTRNPNILKSRGNLNKNLGNLMLEVFTQGQLEEMRAARVIFDIPKREPAHLHYLQWAAEDDISGQNRMF